MSADAFFTQTLAESAQGGASIQFPAYTCSPSTPKGSPDAHPVYTCTPGRYDWVRYPHADLLGRYDIDSWKYKDFSSLDEVKEKVAEAGHNAFVYGEKEGFIAVKHVDKDIEDKDIDYDQGCELWIYELVV